MQGTLKLGVTGGIGSGKSHVCRLMSKDFAIPVYNCDIHARLITLTDVEVVRRLGQLIDGVYDSQGELDKQRLAQYLFSSAEHAEQVNAIIHPAVRRDLHDWLSCHADAPVVAIESAILYESGFRNEVDCVLFVDAPQDTRLRRVIQRDGLTSAEALCRMQSQRPEEARRQADFCLMNDDDSNPEIQLREILQSLEPEIINHEIANNKL